MCGTTQSVPDSYQEFSISLPLINYLKLNYTNANVNSLFDLANRILGGEIISGITASNVNNAVDAINRGFDECRNQVPVRISIYKKTDAAVTNDDSESIFTAYPIPFNDVLKIRYNFDYQSDVQIQIFDTKGALLMTQDDTNTYQNKEVTITPKFKKGKNQLYFVKVITNKEMSIKKILSNE